MKSWHRCRYRWKSGSRNYSRAWQPKGGRKCLQRGLVIPSLRPRRQARLEGQGSALGRHMGGVWGDIYRDTACLQGDCTLAGSQACTQGDSMLACTQACTHLRPRGQARFEGGGVDAGGALHIDCECAVERCGGARGWEKVREGEIRQEKPCSAAEEREGS